MAEQRQVPLPGLEDLAVDAPTEPAPAVGHGDKPGLHVRMFGISEVLDLIKVGDVDRFIGSAVDNGVVKGAVVRSLDATQASDASLTLTITQGLIGSGPFGGNISSAARWMAV